MIKIPRPFPLVATLCTLAGVIVLGMLGHWQQERLIWKNARQDSINREFDIKAQDIELTSADLNSIGSTTIKRGTVEACCHEEG